jgi:hypothetical protein
MIASHKYLDLNLSILNLGGLVLRILKEEGAIKYDELLNKVIAVRGNNAKEVFIQTLSFLFLLGKIEYKKDIDTIEYLK